MSKLFYFLPHLNPPQLQIYLFSPIFTTNMTQLFSLNLCLLLLSLTLQLLLFQLLPILDVPLLLSLYMALNFCPQYQPHFCLYFTLRFPLRGSNQSQCPCQAKQFYQPLNRCLASQSSLNRAYAPGAFSSGQQRALGSIEHGHLSVRMHLSMLPTGGLRSEPPRSGHWLPEGM